MGISDGFAEPTRQWFAGAFARPTAAQDGAWEAIQGGHNALVIAPTGSGKTLAAFLAALDRLAFGPPPTSEKQRCRVVYISPLKALGVDVERNLRAPLAGLRQAAVRSGLPEPDVRIAVRSGDTPSDQRRKFQSKPSDILITTPESLFLLLTSQAREALTGVETVIVDEVHAVAGTKRGAHLALSLERLDELLERPAQRIGLSATVRPAQAVARFLGGPRPARIVAPPAEKVFDLQVVVPVEDLTQLDALDTDGEAVPADQSGRRAASIWPHVENRVAELIEDHTSTLVFANSRRLAERLCNRLNEIHAGRLGIDLAEPGRPPAELMGQAGSVSGAPPVLARAHHGSVSKEQRAEVEEALKAGRLPAVVATSSLELGIDMGAVDLVVQVESPPSVASGLQRVGRAGHQVGAVSRGVIFPKFRGDLVQAAVVAERMRSGAIEAIAPVRNPLDVLAQHIVAMAAVDTWRTSDLLALVRRAAPFTTLTEAVFEAVLDMLAGRYPSDEFAELRPRIVWDREAGTVTGRPGAQRLAVTSGGTIPDRGLFGVFLVGGGTDGKTGGRRVGELDEEMVYESRVGDVFTLGTSSWRIEDITHDKVLVSPAPGQPGRLPFWHGDALGRPLELGRALGAFTRELAGLDAQDAIARLREAGLDEWAAANLLAYLQEQREATRHVPDDRTIVVERFHDELGDWRVVIHSPFGAQVHAPWALAIGARLQERFGLNAQVMHGDDGIVLRLPENDWETSWAQDDAVGGADLRPSAETVFDDCARFPADEIEQAVTDQVGGSALFAARFRECAGRALLLPRRRPGQRVPLWQQRQRASQLLAVASKFASFPIVLETVRECLQDVFDVPGLVELLRDIEARRVRVVQVETPAPSPFAKSLLFGYVAQFMYEGDSPLAERRAAALSVDPSLLAELLGQPELRDLFDAEALADLEAELQHLSPDRHARDLEDAADLLRLLGPLTMDQALARGIEPAWLTMLERSRRAIRVRIAGEERWAAIEDAGRLRDGLGCPLPVGVPEAFTEPVPDPLGDLIARYARTHAPFTAHQVAGHFGLGVAVCTGVLERLAAERRVVRGAFRPDGSGEEWCDARVLRRLRRRTVAALRKQAEPVPPVALARLLPIWQSVGPADSSGPGRHARGADTGVGGDVGGGAWAPDWRAGTVTDPDYGSMRMGRTADWRTGDAMDAAAGRRTGGVFGAGQGMAGSSGGSARRTPDRRMRGVDGVLRAVEQLAGVPVPASALERLILPSRVSDYQPAMLDELTSSGEVVWAGAGALAVDDGWIALAPAAIAPLILPEPVVPIDLASEPYRSILAALDGDAALFFRALASQVSGGGDGTRGRTRRDDRDAGGTDPDAAEDGSSRGVRHDGRDASGAHPGAAEGGAPGRARRDAADETDGGAISDTSPTVRNDPAPILNALWELVWAGMVTNDTYAPVRALLASGRTAHRAKRPTPRGRYSSLRFAAAAASAADPILPSAVAATAVGRWSRLRLADPEADPRVRATAAQIMGEVLLDRYGIVTRGSVGAERLPRELGRGFSAVYRVLSTFEDAGRCRRGYFVEGLGAAQFAADGAIDRLRALAGDGQEPAWRSPGDVSGGNRPTAAAANPVSAEVDGTNRLTGAGANPVSGVVDGTDGLAGADAVAGANPASGNVYDANVGLAASASPDWTLDPRIGRPRREAPIALLLAAADPANAYGAAIPWPERPAAGGHKPGRKAGALVVLVDGDLVLYVERGGRTVLSWSESEERLGMAAQAVADAVRAGRVGALTVTSTDSVPVLAAGSGAAPTPVAAALIAAGFSTSPQGLRMRP